MAIFASNIITSDSALGSAKIQRSLRFNRSDNAKLSKTFSSAGNRKKWTFSVWAKFPDPNDSNTNQIFSYQQGHVNHRGSFYKGSSGVLNYQLRVGGSRKAFVTTDARLRDPNSWYHIVLVIDSDQGSSTNRVKIYINGVQQSVVYHDTPTSGFETWINSTQTIYLGAAADENGGNMYLAECNFIDGSVLTPSSFGFTDPVTGIWMPKRYEGTYGTNGFYLDFSDNSSTAALGIDKSPNGNDWTTTNFSVSAGSDNDSLEDTPTNVFATLNPLAGRGGNYLTHTNGNLNFDIQPQSTYPKPVSTFNIPTSGKWYSEWVFTTVGSGVIGVGNVNTAENSGSDQLNGINYLYTGEIRINDSTSQGSLTALSNNDIVGVKVDRDAGTVAFTINGSAAGNPENISSMATSTDLVFWAYRNASGGSAPVGFVNYGQRPFSYLPSGYKALCSQNLPPNSPSIVRPQKHFDVLTYTGTGSSNSITGLEFSPDLVWTKRRDTSGHHHLLIDTIRGGSKSLQANTADPENSNANRDMTFLANGIRWNSDTGNANASGGTYVSWCWKGGGTAVSNTDGSVTSTVSANPEAGFSIVQFEAQTTNTNITVGHGLGKKPEFWMWKSIDNTIDWYNYHEDLGYNAWLNNSANNAATTGNDAAWKAEPTSTVLTHGSGLVNQNTIMMYVWTSIPGYSKIGTYKGNGSSNGTYVDVGFRPAFVWIKCSSSTFNWMMYDSTRETFNVIDKYLMTNSDNAEAGSSSDNPIDFLSNGFKLRYTNTSTNQSGGTYIYIAFAEESGATPFDTFPNAR